MSRTNLKQLTILYQGPKFRTLFLFQSLFNQIFLALRKKSKSFYLYKHWIGQATHSQHLSFLKYIVVSEVASPISLVAFWVSSPSTNHNAVDNFFFGLLKRHKNKNKNDENYLFRLLSQYPYHLSKGYPCIVKFDILFNKLISL